MSHIICIICFKSNAYKAINLKNTANELPKYILDKVSKVDWVILGLINVSNWPY
jgi:hypothetical protein